MAEEQITLPITGMTCANCVATIERNLKRLPGVENAQVNLASERASVVFDPALLGHDIAYPAMLKFLPVGFLGLMVGGLIAANSSTILTHLNWGASYLVHDFYRRFIKNNAPEKHYVFAGRMATIVLFIFASVMVFFLDTAKDTFDLILQIGAGTGLLYLLRWFWWRITAWCEVTAMASSFFISIVLLILNKNGIQFSTHISLIITILFTTVCWMAIAYFGPQTDRKELIEFYKKVHPVGPGWKSVRIEAGLTEEEVNSLNTRDKISLNLLGWFLGCITIWSALFTVGNFLYGQLTHAFILSAIFILSTAFLIKIVNIIWTQNK